MKRYEIVNMHTGEIVAWVECQDFVESIFQDETRQLFIGDNIALMRFDPVMEHEYEVRVVPDGPVTVKHGAPWKGENSPK